MNLGETYFWTDTILNWRDLLDIIEYKILIINVLRQLVNKNLVKVYGFVIMPNHVHILWRMLAKNGKEMPHASFNKATGHLIIKDLKFKNDPWLYQLKVKDSTREYRVWQRDPLAVLMDSKSKLEQKLDYIHLNPLQEKWNLVSKPEDYKWSSARFYHSREDEFNVLTHYMEDF